MNGLYEFGKRAAMPLARECWWGSAALDRNPLSIGKRPKLLRPSYPNSGNMPRPLHAGEKPSRQLCKLAIL